MADHDWLEGIDPDSLPLTTAFQAFNHPSLYYSEMGWGWALMRWAESDDQGRVYWANEERAIFSTSPTMWHPAPWCLIHHHVMPDEIVLFPRLDQLQRRLRYWQWRLTETWRTLRHGPQETPW